MGTKSAPLVANLFLFYYERDFMMSLSADMDAEITEAFNSTSRHLDDLPAIDNIYFDGMVKQRTKFTKPRNRPCKQKFRNSSS